MFLVMFCTENKQTRGGSQTPRSSMMQLFVRIEVISYWESSSNLDDAGVAELPLYAIIFSFHRIKLEAWRRTKTQRTQTFHILVPFFFSRCEEYNFASSAEKRLSFDRTICILAFLQIVI